MVTIVIFVSKAVLAGIILGWYACSYIARTAEPIMQLIQSLERRLLELW